MFSGFPTKQAETLYNKSVFALLFMLSRIVAADFRNLESSLVKHGDLESLKKILTRLCDAETEKATMPKYSQSVKKLLQEFRLGPYVNTQPSQPPT